MSGKGGVPNAWDDDDWEKAADVCVHMLLLAQSCPVLSRPRISRPYPSGCPVI